MYLGISTFDRNYEYYPAHLISEESLEGYNEIVDNMAIASKNGTLLYYSIDEDITALKKITLPEDLFNVSIVTFTDGLDQGSLSKKRDLYDDDSEYMNAIKDRFANEKVSNQIIKSYAIGLKGSDVQNNTTFQENLNTLASTPQNSSEKYVYMASNMTEVNNAFEKIASQLSQDFKVQKLVITIPFPSGNGTKERFVLDNKTATSSTKYIEGVFDKASLSLKDVKYNGLSSSSGEVVPITEDDGFELTYTFEDIPVSGDGEILTSNIRHYYMRPSDSSWQINSEFDNEENSRTFTEFKSAMVMLNIDLSISLSGQLATLQQSVKSFISKLYTNSVDPDVIKSIKLNKTELNIVAGYTDESLVATVTPSTAPLSGIKWTSTTPSVATVDQNGKVTGVSDGTSIIMASTDDGKISASCIVKVSFHHVESVSLNKTELSMFTGKTETLIATITPDDASDKSLLWSSSNASVASVNSSGVVTANAKGTATITVQSVDGEKTAICSVSVGDYVPSSEPIDLSLAVTIKETGTRGYIAQSELQFADMDKYEPLGLTVLSGMGDFIIALESASSQNLYLWAAKKYYYLPTREQGITMSARFTDINNAFDYFGGDKLVSSTRYWTAYSDQSKFYYICGSGGNLGYYTDSSSYDCAVREVIDINNQDVSAFVTKSKGIYFTYQWNGTRHFVSQVEEIPEGCIPEGIAVKSSTGYGNVILSLQIESSDPMTWSSADSIYGSEHFPTNVQARMIHARMPEVKARLTSNGFSLLINNSNVYYWTSDSRDSSTQYVLNSSGSAGGYTAMSKSNKAYVRFALGTF